MSKVLLSLGSNQGERSEVLQKVYVKLPKVAGPVTGYSSVYESEPWGFDAGTNFLNQVLGVKTSLEPLALIKVLLEIETVMGRKREPGGYQSRVIDIDILFYEDRVINNENLQIPHPRLHLRRFVLEPLAEMDPCRVHPLLGKSIVQLLNECDDSCKVKMHTQKSELVELFGNNFNL